MPHAALDVQFHSNRKVLAMGLDGAGLFARALSYCADQVTDGFVPATWVKAAVGSKRKLPDRLVELEAWSEVSVGDLISVTDRAQNPLQIRVKERGYYLFDYLQFNLSSLEIEARRKTKSRAGTKGAIKRWGDSTEDGTSHGTPIADAIAPAMGDGWQTDSTTYGTDHGKTMATRAGEPSPLPKPKTPTPTVTEETPRANGDGWELERLEPFTELDQLRANTETLQ